MRKFCSLSEDENKKKSEKRLRKTLRLAPVSRSTPLHSRLRSGLTTSVYLAPLLAVVRPYYYAPLWFYDIIYHSVRYTTSDIRERYTQFKKYFSKMNNEDRPSKMGGFNFLKNKI